MQTERSSHSRFMAVFVTCFALVGVWSADARATGEGCGAFSPCASANDYCRFVNIFSSICTLRGSAGASCSGVGQGTCLSSLVCDVRGECRHSPPQSGEACGIGVGCAAGLACSADVGGRCFAPGNSGDACSGIGQGSCASGLVCDANRTCRHNPPASGEPCGAGVSCAGNLVCSAEVGGVCEARGGATDACRGIGQGTCESGLVCDILGECRHSPPETGELCGAGVPCISTLGCSAEIAGRCESRDEVGEICSGIGQGSCQTGLVCDLSRVCRHDPPQVDEPCGIAAACPAGLFCQAGTQHCRVSKTVGEGCSAFNLCLEGLSCEPCFTDSCHYPLQCFPNANQGAITQQQCLALYSPGLHQAASDLGLAMTYGAGDGASAVVSESQQFGVAYGPDGRYGCFTELCGGIDLDVEIAAFVCLGFSDDFDAVGGSSWQFFEEAEFPGGVFAFSTSQSFPLISLSPLVLGPLDGTEDCISAGVSPDLGLIPLSAGAYVCETVLDTVIGGAGQAAAAICGNGTTDPSEGCDDGNTLSGDGCSAVCTVEILCGNGALNPGETCDDGNAQSGDGCSARCRVEPACGDGRLDLGEACDDGNRTAGDGCSAGCSIEPRCGNGLIEPGEACDDGGSAPGDGCSALCRIERPGDIDLDDDVDRRDLTSLLVFRNMPASACPRCDLDRDGLVTVLDGRKLTLACTRPKCATE